MLASPRCWRVSGPAPPRRTCRRASGAVAATSSAGNLSGSATAQSQACNTVPVRLLNQTALPPCLLWQALLKQLRDAVALPLLAAQPGAPLPPAATAVIPTASPAALAAVGAAGGRPAPAVSARRRLKQWTPAADRQPALLRGSRAAGPAAGPAASSAATTAAPGRHAGWQQAPPAAACWQHCRVRRSPQPGSAAAAWPMTAGGTD